MPNINNYNYDNPVMTAVAPERPSTSNKANVDTLLNAANAAAKRTSLPESKFHFDKKIKKMKPPSGFQSIPMPKDIIDNYFKGTPSVRIVEWLNRPQAVDVLLNLRLEWRTTKETVMIWVPDDFAKMIRRTQHYVARYTSSSKVEDISGMFLLGMAERSTTHGFAITDGDQLAEFSNEQERSVLRPTERRVRDVFENN